MVTIHQKLERLTRHRNLSAISREIGRFPTYLSSTLNHKSGVSIKTAAALAKHLGVEAGWLIDDEQGWPAVLRTEAEHSAQSEVNMPAEPQPA